jgi:hypothetical protein
LIATRALAVTETVRGAVRAYYPETNPSIPLDHTAEGSNQPAYKSVIVRLERSTGGRTG